MKYKKNVKLSQSCQCKKYKKNQKAKNINKLIKIGKKNIKLIKNTKKNIQKIFLL